MAIPAALLVFAGYPQITYGAALYAVVSLPAQLFEKESRAFTLKHGWAFLVSGFSALILAIGPSAIQFLPLMELVGESYRREGIALIFAGVVSPLPFLRGLFFFYFGGNEGMNDPSLSSMVALMLSGLLVFLRVPVRIYGHLLGVILLLNLGMGPVSPLFHLLYEYHLIPGLHNFRGTYAFYPVAVLGIAVVAANILDILSGDIHARLRCVYRKRHALLWAAIGIYAAALTYLICRSYMPAYSKSSFLASVLIVLTFSWLYLQGSRRWFPLLAVLILAVDVVALRVDVFNFFDRKILEEPLVVRAIAAEPDVQDFRVMDDSFGGFVTFFPPKDPNIAAGYRRLLKTLSPFPMALQWKVPTINGVTALPLSRNILIMPTLKAEVLRGEGSHPGLRLLDIFGIRYISRDDPLSTIGLTLYAKDSEQNVFIYRNNDAKPRFQVYWNAVIVDTPEQALAGLQVAQSEKIFIEKRRGERLTLPAECATCAEAKPAIKVIEAQAMRYRVSVNMPREGWLFLADANYPGWEATVNGKAQPVYSAQVLGKAVRLQAGRNEVTIRYVPWSFYIGAAISAVTLLAMLSILFKRRCAWW